MIQKMEGSLYSRSYLNFGYFYFAASTMVEQATIWLCFFCYKKYRFPFYHEASYYLRAVTSSALLRSWGSTISKFSPKNFSTSLTFSQLFLIFSANILTDKA